MKTIVYYYSQKGSNKYLAHKIANDLKCEIEEIKPRLNSHLLMLLGLNLGNNQLKTKPENYKRVVLCGPIWMGKLIVPLRNFITSYGAKINQLVFVTCCGSTYENKDQKFGHGLVFNQVKKIYKNNPLICQAFPKVMALPEEVRNAPDAFMKINLNDKNFVGELQNIYHLFIDNLQGLKQ